MHKTFTVLLGISLCLANGTR